ncbi:MAG: CvpA family protein [Alphaproteobacteria bacterium]|nr:CvpA family protein [Alphaproteobacteria bacterium]MCL2505371.1 CvpA family protein [Alphaproteobacteria bacterium]
MDVSLAAENAPFLNTLDYIFIVIVLVSGLLALIRGFVREFLSLCAWVGAYFIAIGFYEPVVPLVKPYISNDKFAQWAAIGAVFLAALIVFSIIGYLLSGLVKGKVFVWLDRSAGLLYGLLRGVVVLCLVYLGAVLILWPNINKYEPNEKLSEQDLKDKNRPPELLINAKSRTILQYGADLIVRIFPQDIIDDWRRDMQAHKVDITTTVKENVDTLKEHVDDLKEHIDEAVEKLPSADEVLERTDSE